LVAKECLKVWHVARLLIPLRSLRHDRTLNRRFVEMMAPALAADSVGVLTPRRKAHCHGQGFSG